MEKALRVIESCKTLEHWVSASRYVALYERINGQSEDTKLLKEAMIRKMPTCVR